MKLGDIVLYQGQKFTLTAFHNVPTWTHAAADKSYMPGELVGCDVPDSPYMGTIAYGELRLKVPLSALKEIQ